MINITYQAKKTTAFIDASKLNLNLNLLDSQKELLEFITTNLIAIALDVKQEEQSRGFDKDPLVVVDGVRNKSEFLAKKKIEYYARAEVSVAVMEIYRKLLSISRVDTGLYKSLHYVFFNGEQIATNEQELESWLEKNNTFSERDRIRFMNIAPYAQKLELIGATSKRVKTKLGKSKDKKQRSGPVVRKPNGTYYLTYRQMLKKYGKTFYMRFNLLPGNYVGVTEPIPPNHKQSFRATFHPKSKYNAGYYLYPSIVLSITEKGIRL